MLVWKILASGGVEEDPVCDVELDNSPNSTLFTMKGISSNNLTGSDTEHVIMMHLFPEQVKFAKLTRS